MLRADQAHIRPFRVVPSLPESLQPLLDIARNLWWTWNPDAIGLFVRLDPELWHQTGHNPVKLLGHVNQERLEQAGRDESFLHEIYRVYSQLDQHLTSHGWFANAHPDCRDARVAYFSAEFGLTECFQIYSGGLGVLAGDHLKSASELGIPLVGVGLLYQHGYFHQYLNADGWQQETYPDLDFANQPVHRVRNAAGDWVKVSVRLPERDVTVALWQCQVGRVPLYLLDTNLPENRHEDRQITRNLYGGDVETRIQQEIILGIGGVRALAAMGIRPTVCHINEGHAAFLALERMRQFIEEKNISFDEALAQQAAGHVFTTHTPVPAGIDRFHPSLVERYFRHYAPGLRLDMEGLLALGRENVFNREEYFSMAVLAIRTSACCNGVSKLHGEVSRRMWRHVWPGVPEEEVPIGHVTNGVHSRSWLSRDMAQLFNRYLGYRWQQDAADFTVWNRVNDIPDEELWAVHSQRRRKLVTWARARIREQCEAHGHSVDETQRATSALDPGALTVGFARRFATYKRATLLLRDRERLMQLLGDEDRPIQILIAGKAHPADSSGKEFIRELVQFAQKGRKEDRARRVVFLENYDINVARYLVSGCDVWLNTPRRGLEASGTSGMKAAVNGVVNCSILDGWWDEAFDPGAGFAIGRREIYKSETEADDIESANLFDLFEQHILPEFYDRDASGLPRRWIARMKKCIKVLAPVFNTNRMIHEYAEKAYVPAHRRGQRLAADDHAGAKGLAARIRRYRAHWEGVTVESVVADTHRPVPVRTPLPVEAVVRLGELSPEEVQVQIYTGQAAPNGDLIHGEALPMTHDADLGEGRHRYKGQIVVQQSGRRGLAVRVLPHDARLQNPFIPGLVAWDNPPAVSAAGSGTTPDVARPAPPAPALAGAR